MKRWMENKVNRQKAWSRKVNGTSARFAPQSKTAKRCVPYSLTTKPQSVETAHQVQRLDPVTITPSQRDMRDYGYRPQRGSLVARCYGWNDYANTQSQLIKAAR